MAGRGRTTRWRAVLASLLPGSRLRVAAYRRLLGYSIHPSCRIGFRCLIDAATVEIGEGASLGSGTRITGAATVRLGPRVSIGGRNVFQAPSWIGEPGSLFVGGDAVVTGWHFFDLTRTIEIGDGTTVGGIRSSFWTHGAGGRGGREGIRIGKGCYLASDVKVAAGVTLPDRTLVGLGSVVVRGPTEPGTFIAGSPARVVKRSG